MTWNNGAPILSDHFSLELEKLLGPLGKKIQKLVKDTMI